MTTLITIWLIVGFVGTLCIRFNPELGQEYPIYDWIAMIVIGVQSMAIIWLIENLCKSMPQPLKRFFMWEL